MEITRQSLEAFRKDFKSAVKDLEAQYGIKVDLGNITYDSTMFRTKMTVTKRNENVVVPSDNASPTELIGRTISLKGEKYEVVDYKPSRPKYPMVIKNARGTRYKLSIEQTKENLL